MTKVKILLILLKDERVLAIVPFIIFVIILIFMLPVVIFFTIFAMLNVGDAHEQQIEMLKQQYQIEGSLSAYTVKAIYFTKHGEILQDSIKIGKFIEDYFVKAVKVEEDIEVEREVLVDGHMETIIEIITQTTTKYLFLSIDEIDSMLMQSPFNFSSKDVINIVALELNGATDGSVGNYPTPVKGSISSSYGLRQDPLNGKEDFHPAIDIVPKHHSPIISIADGVVVKVDTRKGNTYGNNITIRHEQNEDIFYSFSAHLSRVDVSAGDTVKQGDVIGLEGGDPKIDPNPGRTTGHHLHFEIWKQNNRSSHINPMNYIS